MAFEEKASLNTQDSEVFSVGTSSEDIFAPKFKGEIFDTLTNVETGEVTELHGYNLVVDSASTLIAALIKNHSTFVGKGVLFWEVGSGLSSWSDSSPPAPVKSDTKLLTPYFRKTIGADDVEFIDADGNVTSSITNRLQIKVKFGTGEANGYLREFGLFGGNGAVSGTLGSGYMINRKTHGVIYKTSAMELERVLKLTF